MISDFIQQGREALSRGSWEEARAHFEGALRLKETAEALEEYAVASWWLNDATATIDSRERAFQLYKEGGNLVSAARVAIWVALDYIEFRGEDAVANGWLQRARRILEDVPQCAEQGFLKAVTAHSFLMSDKDPSKALALAREASAIAREVGNGDLQMISTAIEGLALVSEGECGRGMHLLDEATTTATTGESKDINLAASTCCYLIAACERVRDYDRAAQWCDRVKEFCRRWRFNSMFAACRTQYASLLLVRGNWRDAEAELLAASDELSRFRPGLVGASTVRLAELRRRQGRWDEASALFMNVEHHILSLHGRGLMALDRGDAPTALEFAQRFLRRVPSSDRTERVPGVELLVRSLLHSGRIEDSKAAAAEIVETATLVPTAALRAASSNAEGLIAAAEGNLDSARQKLEDAVDLYCEANMPFEAAGARRALVHVLVKLQRMPRAEDELRSALEQFQNLEAEWEATETRAMLSALKNQTAAGFSDTGLTAREKEVLHLVAVGKNNEEIADTLFLSIRTVERHISNIYQKIGASGTAARAVATAWALKYLKTGSPPPR